MPSCVMRYCTNHSKKASKSQGITYHSFPANELMRIKWVDLVRCQRREEDWQPNIASKICSVHFKDDDKYESAKGFSLLKKTALPYVELPSSQATPRPNSPNSLDGEEVSDLESILCSPREAALEKCVSKLRADKQELLNKNSNLRRRNKRLQKKVAGLKTILLNLKKNMHVSNENTLNKDTMTQQI